MWAQRLNLAGIALQRTGRLEQGLSGGAAGLPGQLSQKSCTVFQLPCFQHLCQPQACLRPLESQLTAANDGCRTAGKRLHTPCRRPVRPLHHHRNVMLHTKLNHSGCQATVLCQHHCINTICGIILLFPILPLGDDTVSILGKVQSITCYHQRHKISLPSSVCIIHQTGEAFFAKTVGTALFSTIGDIVHGCLSLSKQPGQPCFDGQIV